MSLTSTHISSESNSLKPRERLDLMFLFVPHSGAFSMQGGAAVMMSNDRNYLDLQMQVRACVPARHPFLVLCLCYVLFSPYMLLKLCAAGLTDCLCSQYPGTTPNPHPSRLPLLLLSLHSQTRCCTFIFPGSAHLLQLRQSVRGKHNTVGEKQRRYLSMQITTRCFPFLPNVLFFPSVLFFSFFSPLPSGKHLADFSLQA